MFRCVFHCAFFAALHSAVLFFSSSLADVALRLGPYMSISCRKDVCTRTQLVHMSRQIEVKKPKTTQDHQTTTTRKSPSQTCVSPEETAKQPEKQIKHTKRVGARTKHPQNRFAKGHSGLTTASLSKTCEQNELRTTTFKQT